MNERKMYLEVPNLYGSLKENLNDKKINITNQSVQIYKKSNNLKRKNKVSFKDVEVNKNNIFDEKTNAYAKYIKTRSTSKSIQIESNLKVFSKSRTCFKKLPKQHIEYLSQLKTLPQEGIKLLKVSDNRSKQNLTLNTTLDKSFKFLKKEINLSTNDLSLTTPPKNSKEVLKFSMNTPTNSYKKLDFNGYSRPKTRQMTANAIKLNTSLQYNNICKKSTHKVLKDFGQKYTNARKISKNCIVSTNVDSKTDANRNDNVVNDYECSNDINDENCENVSYEVHFNSSKQGKFNHTDSLILTQLYNNVSLLESSKSTSQKLTKIPIKQLSHLSLKNSLLPIIQHRIASINKPKNMLEEVRLKLHVSVLPKSLPCREEQFNDIYTYLHTKLSDNSSGCIYLSGVPGTGKTATVNEVICCLKKLMIKGKLMKFDFININGMKLSEPRQAYVQIWKQLTGKIVTWEAAHKLLHIKFTKYNSKNDMILLLVDELDLLCTKRQDVVYNLLDWPSSSYAKLIVVTIANTMDLPERILLGRVTSRLGLTRLTFPAYNHKQLEQIILCRLQNYETFSGETIQLVARKVAAVSGDARRALDICRRSTEIAEINGREFVSMIDVKKALNEMIVSPKIQAIKFCSDMEKSFLKAVCAEVTRTGVEEVVFKNVYFQLQTICAFNGEKVPNTTEALFMCARLGSWRLLLCDHSKMDIYQRLLLNVTSEDIHFGVQTI